MSEQLKHQPITMPFDVLMSTLQDTNKNFQETRIMLFVFGITGVDPSVHTLEECEDAILKVCQDIGLDSEAVFRFMGRYHTRFAELVPHSPLFTAVMQQRAREIRSSVYE